MEEADNRRLIVRIGVMFLLVLAHSVPDKGP